MIMKKILTLLLALSAFINFANANSPSVKIDTGTLQGTTEYSMIAFKGIPYAAPPVGDLRWRPPQPAASWTGTRDASKFGDSCPQPYLKNLSVDLALPGNEDCLKLNVFTPQKPGKDLPVMVWIHGGGLLVDGSKDSQFQPIGLVKNDVIVVTFDYRLGALGFFANKELVAEAKTKGEPVGNYGTMDQIAVLKWVKRNIAAFGGNPNNVTIFGESAGGRSVNWLMTSEPARGLFHKAISQSAEQSPLRGTTEVRYGKPPLTEVSANYMRTLGVSSLKELRALPASKLVLTADQFESGGFGGASIDGQIIPGDPVTLFAAGKQAKVPFIIGTNSWDSSLLAPGQPPLADVQRNFNIAPKDFERLYGNLKDKCILSSDILGDIVFRASTKFLANSMNGVAPGYAYYFDYLTPKIRPAYPGAPHTFDVTYVFGSYHLMPQAPTTTESSENRCALIDKANADMKKSIWAKYWFPITDKNDPQDKAISDKMSASWTAFAKTGNPNVDGQANWPIYNLKEDVMRHYSENNQTITGMLKERVDYQMSNLKKLFDMK